MERLDAGRVVHIVEMVAIFRMIAFVAQRDRNLAEVDFLTVGIHLDRHGGAGAQRCEQQVVGCRAGIVPAIGGGFIGDEFMGRGADVGAELADAGADQNAVIGGRQRVAFACALALSIMLHEIARRPARDHGCGELRVGSVGQQVIRARQADEAFGMLRRAEQFSGVIDADVIVGRRMQDQHGNADARYLVQQIGGFGAFDECVAEVERTPADGYLAFSIGANGGQIAFDPGEHMGHVGRCADGRNAGDFRHTDIVRRRQHGRPAQTVTDQQYLLAVPFVQMVGGRDQIIHIGGKTGTPEFPFAFAQPGEIEPQGRDAFAGQGAGDADRRLAGLGTGETMREQRDAAHFPGGQFQIAGQSMACGRFDG